MKKNQDIPVVCATEMVATEKQLQVPPRKYAVEMSKENIIDSMEIPVNGKFTFKEVDGEIYRVDENGKLLSKIDREKYEKIVKSYKEATKTDILR